MNGCQNGTVTYPSSLLNIGHDPQAPSNITKVHLVQRWPWQIYRVATAQGKQGIWFLLFPDRENTGNFVVTQGKFLRHRKNIFDCIYECKKHVSLTYFQIFLASLRSA